MKTRIAFILAIAAALAGPAAAAEPPCWPKQLGSTGGDFKQGSTEDGRWIGWTCQVKGAPVVFGFAAVTDYAIKHPDVTGMTPTKAAGAYWKANVTADPDPRLQRLQAAMRSAFR